MVRFFPVAAVLLSLLPAVGLEAQEQNCAFNAPGGRTEGTVEGGVAMTLIHDPFTVTCDGGMVIRANSGRINNATREVFLYGDVFFEDPERRLTAREAIYDARTAHLIARQEVSYFDRVENMSLRGPHLEYFRVTEQRAQSQMTATDRPVLTLNNEGASGVESFELVADRVTMLGEDDLDAFGSVVITRTDLRATSDEARYNSSAGTLELRSNAVIQSGANELSGEVVQAQLVEGALQHLRARAGARLRGEELDVSGEDLQLFFENEVLQRAVAVAAKEGNAPAEASAPAFAIVADSLDAHFVDERLNEVYAVGSARGESRDTSATASATSAPVPSDWISGDTIIGYFVPSEVAEAATDVPVIAGGTRDGTGEANSTSVDLKRLVAIGSAQSLYRLRGENGEAGSRADLSFLIGDRIELEMANGELEVAEVKGLQYGVYLEANGAVPPAPAVVVPDTPSPDGIPGISAPQTGPGAD